MSRLGRIVVPGLPHHVTQRGNRRRHVLFEDDDFALYRDILAERCRRTGVAVWAYCLMPNHVHLIMVPRSADRLARAVGEAHRQYTGFVNARARWTGHLFQGRFASVALDEAHLIAAARYIALNPVRGSLAARNYGDTLHIALNTGRLLPQFENVGAFRALAAKTPNQGSYSSPDERSDIRG